MNSVHSIFLAGTQKGAQPEIDSLKEMVALIWKASPVVRVAIILLVVFILMVVFICCYKFIQFRRARRQSKKFLQVFWSSTRLDDIYQASDTYERSPIARLFKAGYIELSKLKTAEGSKKRESDETAMGNIGNVERSLRRAGTSEITHLENMIPLLATIGSTSPFIGLFGTVVGIMISFMHISATGSAGMDVVAQGISEALNSTAIGLIAAIPAVIAYNYFVRQLRVLTSQMDNFCADFLNIVRRHFF